MRRFPNQIGRNLEDQSIAIWTLVSVAVRLGETLCLETTPDATTGRTESFFEQQMRTRLWLTICVLDFQTALACNTQPLVRHEKVRSALSRMRHLNDSDFDPATTLAVPDREELTDMTFAYVLCQMQLPGRLLAFRGNDDAPDAPEAARQESGFRSSGDDMMRQMHATEFEEKALGVLRFCDPESSPFAWFTWHSTQGLVAATRAFTTHDMLADHAASQLALNRSSGNPHLLRMVLRVIEKVLLVHTDQRGEGFRWYAHVPLQMLTTAITECCLCDDIALVRRAWPAVLFSYQQRETVVKQLGDREAQTQLSKLMDTARSKMSGLSDGTAGLRQNGNFGSTGHSSLAPSSLGEVATPTSMAKTGGGGWIWPCAPNRDSPFEATSRRFHHHPSSNPASYFPDVHLLSDPSMIGNEATLRPSAATDISGRIVGGREYVGPFDNGGTGDMLFFGDTP